MINTIENNDKVWHTNRTLIQNQTCPEDPYFRKAYEFMKAWWQGQVEFQLQTSGSTGNPKMITVTRQQLSSSAKMTGAALNLPAGTKALVCLNVEYVAGLMMLVRGMELNWELYIMEPSSNPLLYIDDEVRFDFTSMVPMQFINALENPETKNRLDHFEKILLGGAPVSVSLLHQIEGLKVAVYQSYGMTETVSHVALRWLNGSGGKDAYLILPRVDAGVDERGCLYVSGPMTLGNRIQTNDLVEFTGPNSFIWLGRFDNVINSGGVKIILDRVDDRLAHLFHQLGLNFQFFTWFEEDKKLGQKLILVINDNEGNTSSEWLLSEIRKSISSYETPKHIYFVNRFEKTQTDKTDKHRTVEMILKNIHG